MDIYNDCQLNNKIQIVFVAATEVYDSKRGAKVPYETLDRDSQKRFDDIFSCMPWTAIPFLDLTHPGSVCRENFVVKCICMPLPCLSLR